MPRADAFPLPRWRWAYAAFRLGEGAVQPLIPLWVVFHYGLPLWAVASTAAAMNLAAVPAAYFWSRVMESGRGRRRISVVGFLVAAAAMAWMATAPPFPLFLVAAALFAFWGVATLPAAATLVLEGVPRHRWAAATGAMSRNSSFAYLAGAVIVLALGLAGLLPFQALFVGVAVLCAGAALVAYRTVPPYVARVLEAPPDRDVMQAAEVRNDRLVFALPRMVLRRTGLAVRGAVRGSPARLMAVIALLFAGPVAFLSSLPGVLADGLGFSAGLILLAQIPALLVVPFAYPAAVRLGQTLGEERVLRVAAALRTVSIVGMVLVILFVGQWALGLLILFKSLLGISFALMQVSGPCLMAAMHPHGKGAGVGAYHAAVAAGLLVGAVGAFLLLLALPLGTTYAVAMAACLAGSALLIRPLPTPGPEAPSPHAPAPTPLPA